MAQRIIEHPVFSFPVVYVDIETTGGSFRNSRVLEVAAIRVEDGKVVREFNTLLDPETYIPAVITGITGIVSEDIIGKPTFSAIAQELKEVLDGAVFIAHNVKFDYSFLKQEFSNLDMAFTPRLLCTLRLSRALYATQRGHSLQRLIERHNIPVAERHRALEDARAMLYFTEAALSEHGEEAFNQAVERQLKTQSLPPHLDSSQIENIEDVPGVYIFRDEAKMPIYIGKSVTLKKRVMSHFQSSNAKELKIGQHVHYIETIPTGSELAALLLESQMIKELQPLYNRMLRRTSQFAMLIKAVSEGYSTLSVQSGNIKPDTDLSTIYGMFRSRTAAKKKIEEVTRLYSLCPKLMGIEKTNGACFSYSLGRCKGACIGVESPELYNRRFEIALESSRVASWKYASAIAVPINETGESVVIDKWIVKGFLTPEGEMVVSDLESNFDIDEYKIIRRFLRQNSSQIRPYQHIQ